MKTTLLTLLLAVLLTVPAMAEPIVIDNSAAMQGSTAVGADIDWSYEAFKAQLQQQGKDSGINGFLGFAIIDPPRSLNDYQAEYRASKGGPMLQALGISGFNLQNGLVKALMGSLLLIFVAGSVIHGLHRASTGQGDINYVSIALKLLIGVIVVFNPQFVYAVGRTIQTSGIFIARQAVSAVPDVFFEKISDTDQAKMTAVNLEYEALRQVQALISPYALGHPNTSISAYNKAAAKAGLEPVDEPSQEDQMSTSKSLQIALGKMGPLISGNPDFQKELEKLRQGYFKDIIGAEDPAQVQAAYQSAVEKAAGRVAEPAYAIGMKDKAVMLASSVAKNLGSSTNGVTKWISELVTGTINPILLWALIRLSSIILEILLIVLIVVFPLWFLEPTSKAFLGAANGFFGAAIFPAVAFVLLAIWELIMASVGVVSLGNKLADYVIGMAFFSIQLGALLVWLIGAIMILWKSPKISKKILEGGSIAGTLIGTAVTSVIGGALATAGIVSLGAAAAPAAAGALGVGGAGAAAKGAGAAAGTGAKALANGAGSTSGGAGTAGAGGTPPATGAIADQANNAGKQTLQNSAKQPDVASASKTAGGAKEQLSPMEQQIAAQRAKQAQQNAKVGKFQSVAEKIAMQAPVMDEDNSPAIFTQSAGAPGTRLPVGMISAGAGMVDKGAAAIKSGIKAYRPATATTPTTPTTEATEPASNPKSDMKAQAAKVAADVAGQSRSPSHNLRKAI